MSAKRSSAGFTLVEVMIALAILGASLTLLLQGVAVNAAATQRAQMITVATELARAKMYELEEKLIDEGFQQTDEELEGDFEEDGWEAIKWKAAIVKIDLPNLGAMQGMADQEGAEGATAAEGEDSAAEGGMLGGMLGMAGLGGGDGGAGAGLISSQFEIFRNILEESIRKVSLTVSYRVMNDEESFQIDCYFTDPSAITRVINMGPQAPSTGEEGEQDTGGQQDPSNQAGRGRGGSQPSGPASTRGRP